MQLNSNITYLLKKDVGHLEDENGCKLELGNGFRVSF